MPSPKPQLPDGNALLNTLSADQRAHFLSRSTLVELPVGHVVFESEHPIEFVYFPNTALVSLLCVLPDRSAVETAIVGREGMAPMAAYHGVDTTMEQIVVQMPGTLHRIDRKSFQALVEAAPALGAALNRFAHALFSFAAQSSACNRIHSVLQRCARWLLATHDRLPGDEFHITHLFLSQMVGVRRSSVTLAAEALREAGAISYVRGKIHILDRARLRSHSCDCYDLVRTTYDRYLTGQSPASPLAGVKMSEHGLSITHAGDPSARHPDLLHQGLEAASREVMPRRQRDHRGDGQHGDGHIAWGEDGQASASPEIRKAEAAVRAALAELNRAEERLRRTRQQDLQRRTASN